MLRERLRRIRDSDAISIAYEVPAIPPPEILSLEAQLHPDLIVLSTHGRRGFVHLVLGSVTERVCAARAPACSP
jgi:nucleotide-binding universal stress UspA family protein